MATYNFTYDLIIIGDTSAAWMGAYAYSKKWPNRSCALVMPDHHLGGQIANSGLTATDYGRAGSGLVAGVIAEFWRRNASNWGTDVLTNRFEASGAEQIAKEMIAETNVVVYVDMTLSSVSKTGARVDSVIFTSGADTYIFATTASIGYVIGADECGDFNQMAGATVLIGRNAQSEYNEYLAGFGKNLSYTSLSAVDDLGNLLPGVEEYPSLDVGDADDACQTLGLRPDWVIKSNGYSRKIYQPTNYQTLIDNHYLDYKFAKTPEGTTINIPSSTIAGQLNEIVDDMPFNCGKRWLNATPTQRGTYPDTPGATTLWQEFWGTAVSCLFWESSEVGEETKYGNAGNPPSPSSLRNGWKDIGLLLPSTEFRDSNNYPRRLYIRQPKLPVGYYVTRQDDAQIDDLDPNYSGTYPATYSIYKSDPAAIGSLKMDTHIKAAYRNPVDDKLIIDIGHSGNALPPANGTNKDIDGNETDAVLQYQLSARSLLPVASELSNCMFAHAVSVTEAVWRSWRTDISGMNAAVASVYIIGFAQDNSRTVHSQVLTYYSDVMAALLADGQQLTRVDN